jgi:hypothetical protein
MPAVAHSPMFPFGPCEPLRSLNLGLLAMAANDAADIPRTGDLRGF